MLELRRGGVISDDVMNRVLRDIALENVRLDPSADEGANVRSGDGSRFVRLVELGAREHELFPIDLVDRVQAQRPAVLA